MLGRACLVLTCLLTLQYSDAQSLNFIGSPTTNTDCNCIPLFDCLTLYNPRQRITFRQANEIRRRRCGIRGNNLLVCCPGGSGSTTPPPPPYPTTLPLQCGQTTELDKIIGGVNASLGAHPWMVALGYNSRFSSNDQAEVRCGGALITRQHVATAAHCVHPEQTGGTTLSELRIGEWNLVTDPDCTTNLFGRLQCAPPVAIRKPAKITIHPDYNTNRRFNNDVAVIRLDRPVDLHSYVRPICIPDSFTNNGEGYSVPYATGWGQTETASSSDILQEVRLAFADFNVCNETFIGKLSERQLCAGGEAGFDTCFGDSGGPLVAANKAGPPYQLIGLTSFGSSFCGRGGRYGVYTVVADFRTWIEESLKL